MDNKNDSLIKNIWKLTQNAPPILWVRGNAGKLGKQCNWTERNTLKNPYMSYSLPQSSAIGHPTQT